MKNIKSDLNNLKAKAKLIIQRSQKKFKRQHEQAIINRLKIQSKKVILNSRQYQLILKKDKDHHRQNISKLQQEFFQGIKTQQTKKNQFFIQNIQPNDKFQQNIYFAENQHQITNQDDLKQKQQIFQTQYNIPKYFSKSQKNFYDNPFVKKSRQKFFSIEQKNNKKQQINQGQNLIKNQNCFYRISSEPAFTKNSEFHKQIVLQKNKSLKNLKIQTKQQIMCSKTANEKRRKSKQSISKHHVQNIASKRLSLQFKSNKQKINNVQQKILRLPQKANYSIIKKNRSNSLGNFLILTGNFQFQKIKTSPINNSQQGLLILPQRSLSCLIQRKKLQLYKQCPQQSPVEQKSLNMNDSLSNFKIQSKMPLKIDLNRNKFSKNVQIKQNDSFRRHQIKWFQKQLTSTNNVHKFPIKKDKLKLQIKRYNNTQINKNNTQTNKNNISINKQANSNLLIKQQKFHKIKDDKIFNDKILDQKIRKQKYNLDYFKKFPLMKNFRLWKMVTRYSRYRAYSQTIKSLNSMHSYEYYHHQIKIRKIIMKTYSQIHNICDENQSKQIFFIRNQAYLQSRILVQDYSIFILKLLMSNVFKNIYQSNLMHTIVLQYIQMIRSNSYLSEEDAQTVNKTELIDKIEKQINRKYVKRQVDKQIDQKYLQIHSSIKQSIYLYQYQPFQERRTKQKKKCMLKKFVYMQQQTKFNFLFRLLNQIQQKLISNLNSYKIMFVQNNQNQQDKQNLLNKQDKQNLLKKHNNQNKIINELINAQSDFKQILNLHLSKLLKFPRIEDQKLNFFPFFITMKFSQNIQMKFKPQQNIQNNQNKSQEKQSFQQQRQNKQNGIKLKVGTQILDIINQIIALFIRSQYSGINYKQIEANFQKKSKKQVSFENPFKKKLIIPAFLKNIFSEGKLTLEEYQFIIQIFQGVDKYNFFNLTKKSVYKINQIKNSIVQTIQTNYEQLQQVQTALVNMFKSMLDSLETALNQNNTYKQYVIAIHIQKYFLQSKSYIIVGSFIIDFQQFIDAIKSVCQQRKLQLQRETLIKFQEHHLLLMNQLEKYYNQISLTSDDLNQFISSFKTNLDFQHQKTRLQHKQIQLIKLRRKLMHQMIQNDSKKHRLGFMKYKKQQQFDLKVEEVQKLYKRLNIKSKQFEQSISKRLVQNQKLKQSIQKQLQLNIKRLFSTVERSVLQPQKCLQQITVLQKQLQSLNLTIQSLQLIQSLRVTYLLCSSEIKLFPSYQPTVLNIDCMIRLLNNYLQFVTQFQKECNKNFKSFKTKMFTEAISNERYKIKKANNQLYQFQNFVINSFNLYNQYKEFIDLINMLKLISDYDLQTIGHDRKIFSFTQRKTYSAKQIRNFKFTQEQLNDIKLKLSKQLLNDRYQQTLAEIQRQLLKCKLILHSEINDNQVFQNLQQQILLNTSFLLKLQSFDNVNVNQIKPNHGNLNALSMKLKLQTIIKLLYSLQDRSLEYLKLEKMKKNYKLQRIFKSFYTKNQSDQKTKNKKNDQNQGHIQISILWQNLVQMIIDEPIGSLIDNKITQINQQLNVLKISIYKQNSVIKDVLQRKKWQFSVFHLFPDEKILSILNQPQSFFLEFYPFIYKAQFILKKNKNLLFRIKTFYGETVTIVLKDEYLPTSKCIKTMTKNVITDLKDQPQKTYHNISKIQFRTQTAIDNYQNDIQFLNEFHLGIIHSRIQQHFEYFLGQIYQMLINQNQQSIKIQNYIYYHIKEHQQMLSVVYIVQQLRFQQLVKKYCLQSYSTKQLSPVNTLQKLQIQQHMTQIRYLTLKQKISQLQQKIQQQIKSLIVQFNKQSQVTDFEQHSKQQNGNQSSYNYNSHLFNLLLTSKLQFRNKIRYFKYNELQNQTKQSQLCGFFCILSHFFTYSVEKDQIIYLNCYYQKHRLLYQMVDNQNLQIVQPMTQRIQISLFNNFINHKYGLAQQSDSILNLTTRLLNSTHIMKDQKKLGLQTQVFIDNLIKIGLRHPITFLLRNNQFSSLKFMEICNGLFNAFAEIKFIQGVISKEVAYQHAKSYLVKTKYWNQLHSLTNPSKFGYTPTKFGLTSTKSLKNVTHKKKQLMYPRIFLIQPLCTINNKSQKCKFRFSQNSLSLADIQSFNILSQRNSIIMPSNRIIQWCRPDIKFILDIHAIKYGVQQLFNQKKNIQFYFIQKVKQFQTKVYNQINYSINFYDLSNIISNIFSQLLQNYNINQINEQAIQRIFTSYLKLNLQSNQPANFIQPNYFRFQSKLKKQHKMIQTNKPQHILSLDNILRILGLNKIYNKNEHISQNLTRLYQKFHFYMQSFDNQKSIIIYGNQISGKTQFYKRYLNANKVLIDNLIKTNNIDNQNDQTIYFNFNILQLKFGLQLYDDQRTSNYLKLLKFMIQLQNSIKQKNNQLDDYQFSDQINQKGIVIIKNQNISCARLEQIVHYRKFVDILNPTIAIKNSTIIIETRDLKHMPPSIVFNSQLLYFHQHTIGWEDLLLQSGKRISYIFYDINNQPTNIDEIQKKQSNSIKTTIKFTKKSDKVQIINIKKKKQGQLKQSSNPLSLMSPFFNSLFSNIQFNQFFIFLPINPKLLLSHILQLFQSFILKYQSHIRRYFSSSQVEKYEFVYKLLVYSAYWTMNWFIQKSMYKKLDQIIKQSLNENAYYTSSGINKNKQVKFGYLISFLQDNYQFINAKQLQFGQFTQQDSIITISKNSSIPLKLSKIDQVYIQNYQTRIYQYFLSILVLSQFPIVVFGQANIGKKMLINNFLQTKVKFSINIQLCHARYSYLNLLQKLSIKVPQQILFCEKQTRDSIKLQFQQRKSQFFQQPVPKVRLNQILTIFIQDINLKTPKYQILLKDLQETKKFFYKKKNELQQFNVNRICFIRAINTNQAKYYLNHKFVRYYPMHARFQQQDYRLSPLFNNVFDILLRNNFTTAPTSEINKITKKKLAIVKKFIKFFKVLKKESTESSISNGYKNNYLSNFDFQDGTKFFKCFQKKKFKNFQDFLQFSKKLIKINYLYRNQNYFEINKLDLKCDKFLQELRFQYDVQCGLKFHPLHTLVDDQKQYQQILMKKAEYMRNHKSFRLTKLLTLQLTKLRQVLQLNSCPIIIYNKVSTQNIDSFIQFSCQWLGYNNVTTILEEYQIIQYFTEREREIKLINNQGLSTDQDNNNNIQYAEIDNTTKKPSIIYIKFQIFQKWRACLSILDYFMFQKDYLQLFIYDEESQQKDPYESLKDKAANRTMQKSCPLANFLSNQTKIVIQYSQFDMRSMKSLRQCNKKLLKNSHIIHLQLNNQSQQSSPQMICNQFITSENFNGDYDTASSISKNISDLFVGLKKFYNTLADKFKPQHYADIFSYLFSEENLLNIVKMFIHFYYRREKLYHDKIVLINTSLAVVKDILEQYEQKKVIYLQYCAQFIKKQQILRQTKLKKQAIQDQIRKYQNSSQFMLKQGYKHEIIRQKKNFEIAENKNIELNKKSISYSGFLTRNILAQIKSLFLNSYESNKQFFQMISIVALGQYKQAGMKKLLMDLNLLGRLKQIKFNQISQQSLLIINQKIQKIKQQNLDKQSVVNICQWIQTTCLYYLQKGNLKRRRQQLVIFTKQRTELIEQIQKEGAVKQKQHKIAQLNTLIQQQMSQLEQLTLTINQLKLFFVIERHIQTMIFYEQTTHKIKQQYQKQLILLKVSTLYACFWSYFISFITDQNKSERKSFIDHFISALIELLIKTLHFSDYNNMQKQALLQYVTRQVQTIFYVQDQIFKQKFKQKFSKQKSYRLQINSEFQPQVHQVKHWRIPAQLKRKLLLLQYLMKQNQYLVIIDDCNTLLITFCLSYSNKIQFQFEANKSSITKSVTKTSIKRTHNISHIKSTKAQLEAYLNFNDCFFNSLFEQITIIFVKVPNSQWLLKYKVSQQKHRLQKKIEIQVGHYCYKKYLIIPNLKQFAVVFYKQKYQNFNQLTNQFRILSFSSSLKSQEQQMLKSHFQQDILPATYLSYLKLFLKPSDPLFIQLRQLIILYEQDATAQTKLNYYLNHNIWNFQLRRNHLCGLQENHQSLIKVLQNVTLIDIRQSEDFATAVLRIQIWKKTYLYYQLCDKFFKRYNAIISIIYSQFIGKVIQIYKVLLKIKNAFSINNNQQINNSQSKSLDNPDKKYVFFQILKILREGRKLVKSFKIYDQWQKQSIIDLLSSSTKSKTHQLQVDILQGYLLYRISETYLYQYTFTLLYVSIYSLQNVQTSKLDIQNLLHTFPLLSKLQLLINLPQQITPQIYLSNNISQINSIPTLKSKFQGFFKQLLSRIESQQNANNLEQYLRIDDQNSFNRFIQQFQYPEDNYVNGKRTINQDKTLRKLTLFQQFILQKQLCYQHFQQHIYSVSNKFFIDKFQTLKQKINLYQARSGQQLCKKYKDLSNQSQDQKCDLLQLFSNFNAQQTIWICFTQVTYWYSYINMNIIQNKQYQDDQEINILTLELYDSKPFHVLQNYRDLGENLQLLTNSPQLLVIFDFRQLQTKQIILNRDQQIQKHNIAQRYIRDYLSFTSLFKKVIIITSQTFHSHFHEFQRKFQSFDEDNHQQQKNKIEQKETRQNLSNESVNYGHSNNSSNSSNSSNPRNLRNSGNQGNLGNSIKLQKQVTTAKQKIKQANQRTCKAKMTDFRCCSIKQVMKSLTKISKWRVNITRVLSPVGFKNKNVQNSEQKRLLNKKQSLQVSLNTLLNIFEQFNYHSTNDFQKSMQIINLLKYSLQYKKILVQSQQIKKQNRSRHQYGIKSKNKQIRQTDNIQIVSYFQFLQRKMKVFHQGKIYIYKRSCNNQQQKKLFYNLEYIMLIGIDHNIKDDNFIQPQIQKIAMHSIKQLKTPICFSNIFKYKKVQILPEINNLIWYFEKSHLRIQSIIKPQTKKMRLDRFGKQKTMSKVNYQLRISRKRQSYFSSEQLFNQKISQPQVSELQAHFEQLLDLTQIESFYLVKNQEDFRKQLQSNQKFIITQLQRAYENILSLIQIRNRLILPKDEIFKLRHLHNLQNKQSLQFEIYPKQSELLQMLYEQFQHFQNYSSQLQKIRLAIFITLRQKKVLFHIKPFKSTYQQTTQLVKRLIIVNLTNNKINQSCFSSFKLQSVMFHAAILNTFFNIKSLNQYITISYSIKCYRLRKRNTQKQLIVSNHKHQLKTENQTEYLKQLNINNQSDAQYKCPQCHLTQDILSYPIMLISSNNLIYEIHAQICENFQLKQQNKTQLQQQMSISMAEPIRPPYNQVRLSYFSPKQVIKSNIHQTLLTKHNNDIGLPSIITKNTDDSSLLTEIKSKEKRVRISHMQNLSNSHAKKQIQKSQEQKVSINLKISQRQIICVNIKCKNCLTSLRN